MIDTSSRLLRLLAVLQSRRFWAGPELAQHLEVTPRTLRRDVDRLRSLGYAIGGSSGPGGGYQMGQGAALPPLLLDDDEAVAIAVALRSAVDSFAGIGDTAMRVLVKLDQLLPARLRQRAGALQAVTVSVTGRAPATDPGILTAIAAACRDHVQLAFPYRDRGGKATQRTVEPLRLAHTGTRNWYLVAWDLGRADWRTLRVDRITAKPKPGARFIPRQLPADVATYVAERIALGGFDLRARFKLAASADEVGARMMPGMGTLEPLDAHSCIFTAGGETPHGIVLRVLSCGVDFELLDPPDFAPHLVRVAERLQRASQTGASRAK